ncbi:MAG: SCP2 sterol-binding domain-containing protein [Deltaproteobacteria bacterium]|nr:SCP2 sterol-binding domain-containing protein [Deltaproteobacteria bacterium]
MTTADEIMEALEDFKEQCNNNKRLRRMQRDWSKVLHYEASDTGDSFTMTVVEGEIIKIERGKQGTPDVVIETDSETLCDMFWGDVNPTQKYLKGEIRVKGSQEDVMRIDAITAVIWPEV